MSQLTSIEQCKVGMTVYHPVWGKGEITATTLEGRPRPRIRVSFEIEFSSVIFSATTKWCPIGKYHISHLYTEPVFICERIINGHDTEIRYKPVKPETK